MALLKGKRALITGASSGIGHGIAVAFANEGADIVFSYRENGQGASDTLNKIESAGQKGTAIQANMAEKNDLIRLFDNAINALGYIDILVNNAGTLTRHASFAQIPIEDLKYIIDVNLMAPFYLTQLISQHMIEKNIKGSIINVTSMSAEIVTKGLTHYECSKAAMHALTRGAASDLAGYGIRVNAIAPGLIETNINAAQRQDGPETWLKRANAIPLNRIGKPRDIAPLAVFLASGQSDWITGTVIPVDGGIGVKGPFG